jgi:predicted RNase H-like HicB family nuclease
MSTRELNNAEYYLNLRYPIELRELSPEEGGGWMATIPQLGSMTFIGDGDTPEEALQFLDEVRRDLIPRLIAKGVELPEPKTEEDPAEAFSGKVLLRMPRSLHAELTLAARRNDCSLNQYAVQLLARNLKRARLLEEGETKHRGARKAQHRNT